MTDELRLRAFANFPQVEALDHTMVRNTFCDPMGLEDFWFHWYLKGFVDQGQGKVKCLIGRPGSGKTHFLRHLGFRAQEAGYVTIFLDAGRDRIAAIDELYKLIASQVDWMGLIEGALHRVVADELGYPEFGQPLEEFLGWGEGTRGLAPNMLRRDLREAIDRFLARCDLAADFSSVVRSAMNGKMLGELGTAVAIEWLLGHKLGVRDLKPLGVRGGINRRNARAILASLSTWVHYVGHQGLLVAVDNIGVMALTSRVDGRPYYTRGQRDQAYEMIRELIDDSALTPYFMLVMAGNQSDVTNTRSGFVSYPALWVRLQNEIHSSEPNLFLDLLDLDQLWEYGADHTETLLHDWSQVSILFGEETGQEGAPTTMGLEWGLPRRLVATTLQQRIPQGGEI